MSAQVRCPAAEMDTGTLAAVPGVMCRVMGIRQDVAGSPCCSHYAGDGGPVCPVWRGEKERYWRHHRPALAKNRLNAEGAWV